jgi:DNA-binding SARP family transcriptional activator
MTDGLGTEFPNPAGQGSPVNTAKPAAMEQPSQTDGSTVPVNRQPCEGEVRTSLELHVRGAEGKREIVPVSKATFEYTLPGGPTLRFTHQRGVVTFKDLSRCCLIYKDGISKTSGQLEVGSSLEVGSHRILLWDTGVPAAFLKGCTAPYSNDIWPLASGEFTVGRPGRRSNAVSLDHPTVSREHARIVGRDDGAFHILAEASTNPVYLRGNPVQPGVTEQLRHGDLLEVGDLIFRFHQPRGGPGESAIRACLRVESLGGLNVTVAGNTIADKAWRTQYVKWLFAHLAYAWDRPLGTEGLIEELWPESEPEKARNNFKFSLSTLRTVLRTHLPEALQSTEVILRSSSTVQLNPDLLDRHDVIAVQRLVRGIGLGPADDENWEREAQAAVLAYRGPFLPECYLDWAVDARQTLEIQLLELAKALLESLERKAHWEAVIAVSSHILSIDRHAQWACLRVMRGLRSTGRAAEALRLFERNRKIWSDELGLEPEAELLEENERILAGR